MAMQTPMILSALRLTKSHLEKITGSGETQDEMPSHRLNLERRMQELQKESSAKLTVSCVSTSQQTLGALSLKLQQPYWIYHKGSCVHCWVVESVRYVRLQDRRMNMLMFSRLFNASDSQYNYPLMLYMSSQSHPTCPHCGRNPVAWVVNGDVRLGESPSRLCTACWSLIGISDDPDVVVLPFPS